MQGNNRQAYDRGTTLFSPDGELFQVEYAREAVKRGAPCVGVQATDGVVLAGYTKHSSSLMVEESVQKIHKVSDDIGVVSAGHVSDARKLVDISREIYQNENLRHGTSMPTSDLALSVADEVQSTTQQGGFRPYGCSLLFGGVDVDGEYALFEVDPSGAPLQWKATAIGEQNNRLQQFLEDEYSEECSVDDAQGLVVQAFKEVKENVEPEHLDVAIVTDEQFTSVTADELEGFF